MKSIFYVRNTLQFNFNMENLKNLIQDAANQLQCYNFNTSLSLYKRCIQKCQKQKHSSMSNNLQCSIASLQIILGRPDNAISILNQILETDKYHYLALVKRCQAYKKKNLLRKALKDVETLCLFTPENIQIAAMKLQIKNLIKSNGSNSSSQQQSEKQEFDEEELLKFSNLKKIDRNSVSIMIPKGRQSRVTLCGDRVFEYHVEDKISNNQVPFQIEHKIVRKKFIQICEELQEDQLNNNIAIQPIPIVKAKTNQRTKSILKNRNSQLFIQEDVNEENGYRLIDRLQNIDGKPIISEVSLNSINEKEVSFKKNMESSNGSFEQSIIPKGKRKSCLKRSSFDFYFSSLQQKPRTSRFEKMKRQSIDGKVLKSKSRFEKDKQNVWCGQSNESDEDGSQYNIYGNQKVTLSKEIKKTLGIDSQDQLHSSKNNGKRSILKKSSIVMKKPSIFGLQNMKKEEGKGKKSVMFRNY